MPPAAAAAIAASATTASAASGLAAGEVDNAPNQATAFAGGSSAPEPTFRFGAATAPARIVAALPSGATHSSEASAFASCSPAPAPGSLTSVLTYLLTLIEEVASVSVCFPLAELARRTVGQP